jgi:predicted branched-subunit amino acid permease
MVQFIFQIAWVSGATIGALAGSTLPIERVQGLDFALTALFVVLAIDAYRARPTRPDPVVAVVAACCTVVAGLVAPGQIAGVGLPWLRRVPSRPTRAREVATC